MSAKSKSHCVRKRELICILALAGTFWAGGLAGCDALKLGPEPDNYVGVREGSAPKTLTDSGLRAVLPVVPGDEPGGGVPLPGANMPGTTMPAGTNPATMPASTTTRPAQLVVMGSQDARNGLNVGNRPALEVPTEVSVQEAILVSLQNNTNLRIQRYAVPLARLGEEQARSAFDPTVSGSLQGGANGGRGGTANTITGNASITQFLPTGTTIQGSISTSNNFYSEANSSMGADVSLTQALLRGAGLDVNLASLRQAEIATISTQYELRGFAESLVAQIELAYWDLAFAERQVAIVETSLTVAERQLEEVRTRIRLEVLSPSELPSAEAEVASRRESLIDARSAVETTRMQFLQLLMPATSEFWNREITLTTLPFIPPGTMEPVETHVEVALRHRPEISQAKLQLQRGDLEIVQTRNGLLPRLDLFVNLGKTGFAASFGESLTDLNGPGYQALVGVRGDWDPVNRSARATYRASLLSQEQQIETMNNLMQTIQFDVRTQFIEVERTRRQIDASRITRIAQEQRLTVEQGNLRAGRGRSLDVIIAQRDLLTSQLSEVQAVTNHLKSLVTLYRLEGSLLQRRGLEAPGATPVGSSQWRPR